MKCKVCGKKLADHSKTQLSTCLQEAFSIKPDRAGGYLASFGVVTMKSQPSPDKSYFELTLKDGTVIATRDLERSYVEILLDVVYSPKTYAEKLLDTVTWIEPGTKEPEPADGARDVPGDAGDVEEAPMDKVG